MPGDEVEIIESTSAELHLIYRQYRPGDIISGRWGTINVIHHYVLSHKIAVLNFPMCCLISTLGPE